MQLKSEIKKPKKTLDRQSGQSLNVFEQATIAVYILSLALWLRLKASDQPLDAFNKY